MAGRALTPQSTLHASAAPIELRKVLKRRDVLGLAFGAMIGWGWVVLSGEMIDKAGSLGSILALVAGGVMVLFVGLTYAELTSALSRAGGELAFTFVGIGPGAAFLCGWTLVLAYVSVCAFEAVALPTVVDYLIPGFGRGHLWTLAGFDVNATWAMVGVAGALGIGLVNYFGVTLASFVQWLTATALLLIGLALFIPGTVMGDTANLSPLFTSTGGFLSVVVMTPFLFLGFDVIPQIAEEIDVPFRAVGRLILISILMAVVWYGLVQWTVGVTLDDAAMASRQLATGDAMSVVYQSPWGGRVLVLGGLLGIITSWNAFFIGASRLLFAMARGGMLPAVFARLHPRYESPVAVIALVTAVTCLAPFFGRPALVWLVDAGGFAAVIGFFLVAVAFLRIRRKYPDLPRPYRVPAPRLVGGMALLTTIFFLFLYMPGSPAALLWPHEWLIVVAWALLGTAFFVSGRKRIRGVGRERQAELMLGGYAAELGLASPDAARVVTPGIHERTGAGL
jgi:basic amino acid/polyamine antiporter, APA family